MLTRNLTFTPEAMGPNQLNGLFLINGTSFDMNVINYTIPLDNIEIWSIFNQSGIAHPFHIHDVQFFVLDRNGAAPPLSEQGRKDVILIKPMETVRVIKQFNDFANPDVPYMYHCHMLVHEDDAMMGQFLVVDNTSGIYDDLGNSNSVEIYPNPVTGTEMFVKLDSHVDSYEILNTQGKIIVYNQSPEVTNDMSVNIDHLPEGIYILKINSGSKYYSKKFIRK
jgi:bilirubin oxidase